jgi:hypothetical protein
MLVLSPLITAVLNLVQKASTDGSLWADIADTCSTVVANTAKDKHKTIDFFILRPSDPLRSYLLSGFGPLVTPNAVDENFFA